MSALLIEDLQTTPAPARPRWRHVPQTRGPVARPSHPAAPARRPEVAAVPLVRVQPAATAVQSGWQLTRRGLAVVVALFLSVAAAAAVTVVAAFLSVPAVSPAPASGVSVLTTG